MFKDLSILFKLLIISIGGGIVLFLIQHFLEIIFLKEVGNGAIEVFVICWLIIAFSWLFFQTFKYFRFPRKYYTLLDLETPRLYQKLQVNIFQTILINTFFKHLNPRVYLKGKGREYIRIYFEETKQAETSHVFSFILTIFPTILLIVNSDYITALWLQFYSVLFNVYPILLQRKNRYILEKRFASLLTQDS